MISKASFIVKELKTFLKWASKDDKSIVVKAFNTLEKVQIKDIASIDNFVPKYELKEYNLNNYTTLGVDNEFINKIATVEVHEGSLIVVRNKE